MAGLKSSTIAQGFETSRGDENQRAATQNVERLDRRESYSMQILQETLCQLHTEADTECR